ncbi:MAG TPA: MBL fold metallo-hydrolase [Chitinophagaceae bacterium]|nr:MBL fold metallo-hydrolase [Chitinophagaceae bacterium]
MSLFITSLGSGSNGNCYFVGNSSEAILVDAGISCRETVLRMSRLGLSMDRVKAIFVSHEHADHISGIRVLSKKYRLPVYITPDTLRSSGRILEKEHIRHFSIEEPVTIGELSIKAFKKCHDAIDPHSFMISSRGINIGVFTDIGNACKQVITHFSQCDAAFLESNYCENMLRDGNYPFILKKRISGGDGHLSNSQALELFTKYRGKQLKYLILSHLSENNNNPSIVEQLFSRVAGDTHIVIASRYKETEVFEIRLEERVTFMPTSIPTYIPARQLSLF